MEIWELGKPYYLRVIGGLFVRKGNGKRVKGVVKSECLAVMVRIGRLARSKDR